VQAPPAVLVVGRKRECALFFGKKIYSSAKKWTTPSLFSRKRRGSDSVNLAFPTNDTRSRKMPLVFVKGGREKLFYRLTKLLSSYTEVATTVFSEAFADVNRCRDVSVIPP